MQMIFTTVLTIAACYILPSVADGTGFMLGTWWNIENTPSDGLKDITFPMSMPNATHKSGYYFMQSFLFQDAGDNRVGYTGLQPRENSGSSSVVHGVFSSFVNGSTTTDPNCHSGADDGPGVSCAVEISVPSYDHMYHLAIENTEGTTWKGTLVDTVTKEETHIGSYTLPSQAKGISSSFRTIVEYYSWNGRSSLPCNELPWTEAYFGVPTTATKGAGPGHIDAFKEETTLCKGKINFSQTATSDGGYIPQCGFK